MVIRTLTEYKSNLMRLGLEEDIEADKNLVEAVSSAIRNMKLKQLWMVGVNLSDTQKEIVQEHVNMATTLKEFHFADGVIMTQQIQ